MRANKTDLARYETMDMGKPIDEAEWDMVRQFGQKQWCLASLCVSASMVTVSNEPH